MDSVEEEVPEIDDEYQDWINNIIDKYGKLQDRFKNYFLGALLNQSGSNQLTFVAERLNVLLYRDFIGLLPIEVSYRILEHLDRCTLVNCLEVSSKWEEIVSSCNHVWRRLCNEMGVATSSLVNDDVNFKEIYMSHMDRLERLKSGKEFTSLFLEDHKGTVTALYFKEDDGKIGTGSDDHSIRIWDSESGLCLVEMPTAHTVSSLKFDDDTLVIGSFFGTVVKWNLNNKEEAMRDYAGHVNSVPTLDFDKTSDLLITASYDTTIKVWRLSNGHLLKSITQEIAPFPIFRPQVNLIMNDTPGNCHYTILACYSARGDVLYYSSSDIRCSLYRMTESHTQIIDCDPGNTTIGMPRYELPFVADLLRCNLKNNLPDFDRSLPKVTRLETMPLLPHERRHIAKVRSYGSCYCFFLNTGNSEVVIYDRKTLTIMAQIPLPRCSVRGHGLAVLCNNSWLNGMTDENTRGLLFIIARERGVQIIKWSNQDDENLPEASNNATTSV